MEPVTANSGTISDPLSGIAGWLSDGLSAATLILMLTAIATLRPAVRRRAAVLLLRPTQLRQTSPRKRPKGRRGRCWPTCSTGTGARTSRPGGGTSTSAR